jgi:hypothetical protein
MEDSMQEILPMPRDAGLAGLSERMQKAIEDQFTALAAGVTDCLESARAPASGKDGVSRACERADAVKIAEATAALLQAVARAKGAVRYDYRIMRDGEAGERKPKLRHGWSGVSSDLLTQAEYDALDEWEKEDYNLWTEGRPPRWNKWPNATTKSRLVTSRDLEQLRIELDEIRDRAAATPLPPENRGSNEDEPQASDDR